MHVCSAGDRCQAERPVVVGSETWSSTHRADTIAAKCAPLQAFGVCSLRGSFRSSQRSPSAPPLSNKYASRERSTALLSQRIEARTVPADPVIITGDFNVGEKNPALETLIGPFVDTFRAVHPHEQSAGTFTAFEFGKLDGEKIDYVLVQPGTEVLDAQIARYSRGSRYPSDHFPVVARVRLPR